MAASCKMTSRSLRARGNNYFLDGGERGSLRVVGGWGIHTTERANLWGQNQKSTRFPPCRFALSETSASSRSAQPVSLYAIWTLPSSTNYANTETTAPSRVSKLLKNRVCKLCHIVVTEILCLLERCDLPTMKPSPKLQRTASPLANSPPSASPTVVPACLRAV